MTGCRFSGLRETGEGRTRRIQRWGNGGIGTTQRCQRTTQGRDLGHNGRAASDSRVACTISCKVMRTRHHHDAFHVLCKGDGAGLRVRHRIPTIGTLACTACPSQGHDLGRIAAHDAGPTVQQFAGTSSPVRRCELRNRVQHPRYRRGLRRLCRLVPPRDP